MKKLFTSKIVKFYKKNTDFKYLKQTLPIKHQIHNDEESLILIIRNLISSPHLLNYPKT